MKKLPLFMASALALLAGCTTYHTERGAQRFEVPESVGQSNYITQYEFGKDVVKAKGSATIYFSFFVSGEGKYADTPGFFFSPTSTAIHEAKSAATYKALTENNADQLLAAIYDYEVTSFPFFATVVTCEVTGYPARITGVEPLQTKRILVDEDQKLIDVGVNDCIIKP